MRNADTAHPGSVPPDPDDNTIASATLAATTTRPKTSHTLDPSRPGTKNPDLRLMAVVVGRHRSGGGEDAGCGNWLITTLLSSGFDVVDNDEGGQGRRRRKRRHRGQQRAKDDNARMVTTTEEACD